MTDSSRPALTKAYNRACELQVAIAAAYVESTTDEDDDILYNLVRRAGDIRTDIGRMLNL